MKDLAYFAKLAAMTVAVVVVLQLNVGGRSLETHAMNWLQSSSVVAPLHAVAHGGGKMFNDLSERVHGVIRVNHARKRRDPRSTSTRLGWAPAAPKSKPIDFGDGDPD